MHITSNINHIIACIFIQRHAAFTLLLYRVFIIQSLAYYPCSARNCIVFFLFWAFSFFEAPTIWSRIVRLLWMCWYIGLHTYKVHNIHMLRSACMAREQRVRHIIAWLARQAKSLARASSHGPLSGLQNTQHTAHNTKCDDASRRLYLAWRLR